MAGSDPPRLSVAEQAAREVSIRLLKELAAEFDRLKDQPQFSVINVDVEYLKGQILERAKLYGFTVSDFEVRDGALHYNLQLPQIPSYVQVQLLEEGNGEAADLDRGDGPPE